MGRNLYAKERDRALRDGDLAWVRRRIIETTGQIPGPKAVEAAFHTARLECVGLDESLRRESAAWLLMRGLSRYYGGPVPLPDEPLPE